MRRFVLFFAVIFSIVVLLGCRGYTFPKAKEVNKMILSSKQKLVKGLVHEAMQSLLEAVVLTVPHTGYAKDTESKLKKAAVFFRKSEVFSPGDANLVEGFRLIKSAYESIKQRIKPGSSTGKKVPVSQLASLINRNLDTAAKLLKSGNNDKTVELLLESMVLMSLPTPPPQSPRAQ
ncbi:MAG: hypothetical protein GY757_43570 [bacterium]|nr:hypothetical protein [bacterium]